MAPFNGNSERMPGVRTFILAGGLGTRLRPLSGARPKSMMPVGGQPFLERLIERLGEQQLSDIVLCLGHGAADISAYFDVHAIPNVRLQYSKESEPRGTAGALRVAETYWADENLILNGDTELRFEFGRFSKCHRTHHADITIGTVPVRDTSGFGCVRATDDGRVLEFREKDKLRQAGLVNAGIYLATLGALSVIPEQREVSIEKEWIPSLLHAGRPVFACSVAEEFIDIGTPENYRRLTGCV
jgi:NDP-sugar pyrophosphorylase family protein